MTVPPADADPPRVAVVTGNYHGVIDGVALTTNRLVAFLEGERVPVRVFAPSAAAPALRPAGELVSVPSVAVPSTPYRLAVWLTPAARRELAAFRPTVVHLATPDLLGLAALDWARRRRTPVVATYHTHFSSYLAYYGFGPLEPLAWAAQRWFYRRCDEVYVAAASMAGVLRDHGIAGNVREAPLGVDLDQFHPGRRSAGWRRARGFADADVVVAFVGRLVWEKGLEVFARALDRLAAGGVAVRPLVVGDGPAGAALRMRLPHAVFTGRLGADELATAFASADVFLYPSASETFGLVTVEALASGLAAVVADATGSRDIVRAGVDGLVCPPGDVTAFAAAVRALAEKPGVRAAYRAAGPQRAARYGWDAVHRQMLANYRRLTASSVGQASSLSLLGQAGSLSYEGNGFPRS